LTLMHKSAIIINVNRSHGGTLAETEVQRLRKERGLSQQELATLAGFSINTVVRMETDPSRRKGGFSIASASAVARALEVRIEALFPNTVLNPTQGRPLMSGCSTGPITTIRDAPSCTDCGTQVSRQELADGISECCSAEIAV